MSPTAAAEFTKQWPALKRRLERFLRSKGVHRSDVDDLVQETATRLLSVWHKFDRRKPVWPLTATIALNLLRDRAKKRDAELPGELPEVPSTFDAAHVGLARLELALVLRAMNDLTPPQRAALLQVLESPGDVATSTSSEKMLRLRARKRLANAVGRASAGLCLKLRRTSEVIHAFFAKGDVVQALACATCLFVTTAGAATLYPRGDDADRSKFAPATVLTAHQQAESPASIEVYGAPTSEGLLRPSPSGSSDVTSGEVRRAPDGGTRGVSTASDGESVSGSADHTTVSVGEASLPADAPVPAPPDAPTSPPEAPAVTKAPGSEDDSPVQVPTGDAPVELLDEATETLSEVAN